MSASDFHVYNCCLPKSLFTWGDCKEFILGPPVAVDSASPPFEAPSMNWEKNSFFCTCLFDKKNIQPSMRHFCFFDGPSAGFGVPAGRPFVSEAPENEKPFHQKLGVSTKDTKRISQVAATSAQLKNPRFVARLPVQSSSICWASTCCCFAKRAFSSSAAAKLWNFDGSNAQPYQMKQFEGVTSSWKQANNKIYSTTYYNMYCLYMLHIQILNLNRHESRTTKVFFSEAFLPSKEWTQLFPCSVLLQGT